MGCAAGRFGGLFGNRVWRCVVPHAALDVGAATPAASPPDARPIVEDDDDDDDEPAATPVPRQGGGRWPKKGGEW